MSDMLYSKIRITVPSSLSGEEAIITDSKGNTRTIEMHSPFTDVMVPGMEKYTVQAGQATENINMGYGEIKKVEGYVVKIVSWAEGTWQEIKDMLDAHDAGRINIYDYWHVGDIRQNVPLSAISDSAVNCSDTYSSYQPRGQSAQNINLVLMHAGNNNGYKDDNNGNIHFIVGLEKALATATKGGQLSNPPTNAGNYECYRKNTGMRVYSNAFYNALPTDLKNIIKTVSIALKSYSTGSTITWLSGQKAFVLSLGEFIGYYPTSGTDAYKNGINPLPSRLSYFTDTTKLDKLCPTTSYLMCTRDVYYYRADTVWWMALQKGNYTTRNNYVANDNYGYVTFNFCI